MSDQRVIDVGAGEDPDPRATETADIRPTADHQFDVREEWPFPEDYADMIIARHLVEHLSDPTHFFDEAARVVRPGGRLEIVLPIGQNAITDLDHEQEWLYCTPEQYCVDQQRPWDPDTQFRLVKRDIDVYLGGPISPLTPVLQAVATIWPAWATYRCDTGELRAQYTRVRS